MKNTTKLSSINSINSINNFNNVNKTNRSTTPKNYNISKDIESKSASASHIEKSNRIYIPNLKNYKEKYGGLEDINSDIDDPKYCLNNFNRNKLELEGENLITITEVEYTSIISGIQERNAKITKLVSQNSYLKSLLNHLSQELGKKNKFVEDYQSLLESSKLKLMKLNKKYVENVERNQNKERVIKNLEEKVGFYKVKYEEKEDEIKELLRFKEKIEENEGENKEKMISEINKLNMRNSELSEENMKLKYEIISLEKENSSLTHKIEEAESDSCSKISALESESKRLKKKIKENEVLLLEYKNQAMSKESELSKSRKNEGLLKNRYLSLKEENRRIKSESEEYRVRINECLNDNKSKESLIVEYKKEINALEGEISVGEENIKYYEQLLNDLNNQVLNYRAENGNLMNHKGQLDVKLNEANEKIKELTEKLGADYINFESKLKEQGNLYENLSKKHMKLKEQNKSLKKMLNDYKNNWGKKCDYSYNNCKFKGKRNNKLRRK